MKIFDQTRPIIRLNEKIDKRLGGLERSNNSIFLIWMTQNVNSSMTKGSKSSLWLKTRSIDHRRAT